MTTKPKVTTNASSSSSSSSASSSSSSSSSSNSSNSSSSEEDRKRFIKMTTKTKKKSNRRKSERIKRTKSAKNIFGLKPIYKKKASTPTASSSNNHFRPGSARNMHIEYTENIEFEKQRKHRSVGDEYENVSNT